jgi:hypothetical protein
MNRNAPDSNRFAGPRQILFQSFQAVVPGGLAATIPCTKAPKELAGNRHLVSLSLVPQGQIEKPP